MEDAERTCRPDRNEPAGSGSGRAALCEALFAATGHLVIVTDPSGVILDLNPAAERRLGYRREELAGRATPLLFHDRHELAAEAARLSKELGEPVAPDIDVFTALPRRGRPYRREWTFIRKDGSHLPLWLEMTALYGRDGALLGYAGLSGDAGTSHARERAAADAQAALRAREEAERANLSKSKFLAAASHDLRQPLQSALLFAAALAPALTDPRAQRMAANLEMSLEALRALLDRLLDISKLDAGAVQARMADIPIAPLLEELNATYAPRAAAKGLGWRVDCAPTLVRSDPDLLGRILRNLVENALTYTLDGGVEVLCAITGTDLTITVRDSGIGIPADKLDEIFQEFTQLGNPERDRNQGLGLGLAIVRRLSRLIGHPVRVQSRFGVGSEFSVTVPLAAQTGAAPCDAPEPPASDGIALGDGRLVLLVEDDALVRAGLVAMIRQWGYRTMDAGCWEEADAALRGGGRVPDAVIADYRLRDGVTGVSVLRALGDLYDAPVRAILLTGETGALPQVEARSIGCPVLHKPISPALLQAALGELFQPEGAPGISPE
ncbi:ATP-binding protein [Azospirillum isscasi]|uniref:histidine kinase n=1 Tax=Azospirillum isscasi TaxID=3053926 RepID=A0ABU0WJY9_9PROT|nr:ATP-binding protein [Azospirillum isscasi]MDQ2104485.1 ATP-binding protein [Azospirillum isscasi]